MADTIFEDVRSGGERLIDEIRRIVQEGNARKILVFSKSGKKLFEAPLTITTAGAGGIMLLHPIISAVAAFVMFTNDVRIVIERYDENGKSVVRDDNEIEADYIPVEDEPESETNTKKDEK